MSYYISCTLFDANKGCEDVVYLTSVDYSPSSNDFVASVGEARMFASMEEASDYAKAHFSEGNDIEFHQLDILEIDKPIGFESLLRDLSDELLSELDVRIVLYAAQDCDGPLSIRDYFVAYEMLTGESSEQSSIFNFLTVRQLCE